MNFIPSFLSSPFISVSTFPSHAHLLFEQPGLLHHASEHSDFFLCDFLLRDLHLSDEVLELLRSGKINNRLLCEMMTHPRFR